jgi:hypothetical protein
MNFDLPIRDCSRNATIFFASCLVTSVLMWLLMLDYEFAFTLPFAFSSLLGSSILAWFILRRWRIAAPIRCAFELGICGGLGGLGVHTLFAWHCLFISSLFWPGANLLICQCSDALMPFRF